MSEIKAHLLAVAKGEYGPWCPECGRRVSEWERICFGPNQGVEYRCHWCTWRGRNPEYGQVCGNTFPDYDPRWPVDPPHPTACACSGKGHFGQGGEGGSADEC